MIVLKVFIAQILQTKVQKAAEFVVKTAKLLSQILKRGIGSVKMSMKLKQDARENSILNARKILLDRILLTRSASVKLNF
jgi:hypothetical protein